MTVSTQVDHVEYVGNGTTTSFDYPFRIFHKTDLEVITSSPDDIITMLKLDTDYTVSGVGSYFGGKVTLTEPLTELWGISITRVLPVVQETDLRNQGRFFPEVHEDALDYLTMLIQRCWGWFGLALRKPSFLANYYDALGNYIRNLSDPARPQDAATKFYVDSTVATSTIGWQKGDEILNQKIDANFNKTLRTFEDIPVLPDAKSRANMMLAFNDTGKPIIVLPPSGSASDVLIELAKSDGMKYIGVCPDVNALRTLSVTPGQKIMLLGYYSTTPGVGGGTLYSSDDVSLADDGVRVFVTADGTRLVRETDGVLYASWAGVKGDWDGVSGTDNKEAVERLIEASGADYEWVIDLTNVGVSSVVIDSKHGWRGRIDGSVHNISEKPVEDAINCKDTEGGKLPTFKITNSNRWELSGTSVDNRYREAFYIEYCDSFLLACDNIGSGINDNLAANYIRYCNHFRISNMEINASGFIPDVGYYDWLQALLLWDCSGFRITGLTSKKNGGNGIYIGSNCKDYLIDDFDITENAMSGIQLAWSTFGFFPMRGVISNGIITGNRADGIDVNNTSGYPARIDLLIDNVISASNGYNTDGTVTADGTGIGTFNNVTNFSVINCSTTDPASSGLGIGNCSNFRVTNSFIKKDRSFNNRNHGVYIENSTRFTIDVDVIVDSLNEDMFSIRLYGVIEQGVIKGTYVGRAIFGDDANYADCMAKDASFISPITTGVKFPFENVYVNCSSGTATLISANMSNCRVVATAGNAGALAIGGVDIDDCEFSGRDAGLFCHDDLNMIRANGSKFKGNSGPGLRISGGGKHIVQGCVTSSTSGNSTLLLNATDVVYIGNDDTAAPYSFSDTVFTLKN